MFRGFITYYGKHYMAYFYSEKLDYWLHFDDSRISEVGNFEAVIEKCLKGKEKPILLFYESLEFIEEMIRSEAKPYYSPSEYLNKKNNFWYNDKATSKILKKRKRDHDWIIF